MSLATVLRWTEIARRQASERFRQTSRRAAASRAVLRQQLDSTRLSILIRTARQRVDGWLAAEERARPTFEVVGGIHSGVRLDLETSRYTVGSSPEADIVLRDPGIAAIHATLDLQTGWRLRGPCARLEAVGGDVELDDGVTVPHGHGCRLALPVDLVVGAAAVRVARTGKSHGELLLAKLASAGAAVMRKPALVASSTLCAVFAVSVVAYGLPSATPESAESADATASGSRHELAKDASISSHDQLAALPALSHSAAPASATDEPARKPGKAADPGTQLGRRLAQAGIGSLRVQEADGRLVVSGALPKGQAGAWTAIQQWFDQRYGGEVMLISNVAVAATNDIPRLAMQAIWFGERPYVIASDGTRYYEGAFVDDGWLIEEISEQRLLLAKDGSTVALTYR